jgi:hypothetical protein
MKPTTRTTQELKQHLHDSMGLLKTLRDEIRVELHLAGMEAKERWKKIEPRFEEAEKFAVAATHASKQALENTVETFKSFKDSLKKSAPTNHSS